LHGDKDPDSDPDLSIPDLGYLRLLDPDPGGPKHVDPDPDSDPDPQYCILEFLYNFTEP